MSAPHKELRDWDHADCNPHPFKTCPVCDGIVEVAHYQPFVKSCLNCEKSWPILLPLTFRVQAHNRADAIAYSLYEDNLSWTAVSIIMRTYHNVEIGATGWRNRINDRYVNRRRK